MTFNPSFCSKILSGPTFKKILCLIVFGLLMYVYIIYVRVTRSLQSFTISAGLEDVDNFKYILQWTPADTAPFDEMRTGRLVFIEHNCEYTNCYVTDNRNFLTEITDFHAVVFNAKDVSRMRSSGLPTRQSPKQKYIFASMESSHYYPVCFPMLENYFNYTWTYKLDSDFLWGYFTVYDINGSMVGPAIDMKWLTEMDPIDDELKKELSLKTKAVAWFVSNCQARNHRDKFVKEVEKELQKYNWNVDIYGSCGRYRCPRFSRKCDDILKKDYYFYFSFENSFSEDYVTEKVLTALNNFAVPVVYGTANYSRFLPPGSYLDGKELGTKKLAETIDMIIHNQTLYHDYHRWRKYYRFGNTNDNNSYCKICAMLNNGTAMEEVTIKENIRDWWNGKTGKC